SVRREGQRRDGQVVAGEAVSGPPRRQVPDVSRPVSVAPRGQGLAIWGEGQRGDRHLVAEEVVVAEQVVELPPGRHVPEGDRERLPGDQPLAVRAEGEAEDVLVAVVVEAVDLL